MKTIKKAFLPDSIIHNGKAFKMDANLSACYNMKKISESTIIDMCKQKGKSCIMVMVTNSRLKGKTDLYGGNYLPNYYIFTD